MQNNYALKLHNSKSLFKKFCRDMEILPSYTPIFMIDGNGQIVEKKKLSLTKDDFMNIISITEESNLENFAKGCFLYDVYVLLAANGEGKEFIVVSKDKYGFSRCVICSCSDKGCIKLHDYIEKLSCYKDYLDSFESLSFSDSLRMPALRMFNSRINGASELMKLSESAVVGRMVSFPLKLALEKICSFAFSANGSDFCNAEIDDACEGIAVETPENFFKLAISLLGLLMRESRDGTIRILPRFSDETKQIYLCFCAKSSGFQNEMFKDAVTKAFMRSGFEAFTSSNGEEISFNISVRKFEKPEKTLADVQVIMHEIDVLLSAEVIRDLYLMTANI